MHNKLQAKLLLDSTLANLDNYKLTPIPDNYRLWFEYAAGTIDELNQEVDALLNQQTAISEAICQQLFVKHIASDDQRQVDDTRIAIAGMLGVVVDHLKDWDSSTSQFCETLNLCLEELNQEPDINTVKDIVITVTNEAKRVRDANFNIKDTLVNLSEEISALRQDVERLGNQALTDTLTQIMNRRGFNAAIQDFSDKALTEGIDCSLLVIDIDNFKQINDNFGHQVGDKILRFTASTFRKNVRGSDILARYGGEEFAIILPHTNLQGAMQVADNLRQAISARQLTTGSNGKVIGRLTISIGVSMFREGDDKETFFARADKAMYQAKKDGKDRVIGTQ